METSSCTTGLLCFHSSNRPCAIPKSVSGSGYQKTIVCCLSIFSGVYLGNGRRCRYCISLIGNFLCTFIQQVRGCWHTTFCQQVRGFGGIPNFVLGQKKFWLSKWKRQKESVETKEKRNETACMVYSVIINHNKIAQKCFNFFFGGGGAEGGDKQHPCSFKQK